MWIVLCVFTEQFCYVTGKRKKTVNESEMTTVRMKWKKRRKNFMVIS